MGEVAGAASSFKHATRRPVIQVPVEKTEENFPHPAVPPEILFAAGDVGELRRVHEAGHELSAGRPFSSGGLSEGCSTGSMGFFWATLSADACSRSKTVRAARWAATFLVRPSACAVHSLPSRTSMVKIF